jgi:hypothetical protein
MDNQSVNSDNKNDQDNGTHIDVISKPNITSSGPPSTQSPSSDSFSDSDPISDDTLSSLNKPLDKPLGQPEPSSGSALGTPGGKPVVGGGGRNKPRMLTILLALVIIVVFVGGMYGVYAWQHNKLKTEQATNALLENKVATLTGELLKKPTTITTGTGTTTTTPATFTIKELGIEFTPTAILTDLTYAANSSGTTANISTQTLTDLDSGCTANATTGTALGSISKGSGQFAAKTGVTLVKQYPTYYISYTAPTAACSKDTQVSSLATTLQTDLKSIFSTIQQTSSTTQ